jgi:hypothetical protein
MLDRCKHRHVPHDIGFGIAKQSAKNQAIGITGQDDKMS